MLLAIDTANRFLSLSVSSKNGDFYFTSDIPNLQLEIISHEVDLLCKKSGFSASDLTEVVVNRGIGSFNGIRVGVSYAVGLTSFSDIKLKTITTHDILYHKALLDCEKNGDQDYCQIITKGDGLNKLCVGKFSMESLRVESFINSDADELDGGFIISDADLIDSFDGKDLDVVYVSKNSAEALLAAAKLSSAEVGIVDSFYFRGFL